MSQGPPTRPAAKSAEVPRGRFNWPPTEDDLAQYGAESPRLDTELEEAELEASAPPPVDASPAADTINLFRSETRTTQLAAFPREGSPPSDSAIALVGEPPAAPFTLPVPEPFRTSSSAPESWTPVDEAQTPSDGEEFEHSWSEARSTVGFSVSPGATAVAPPGTGDFPDEIAHLQAMIEGLTQNIEWRIPNLAGR